MLILGFLLGLTVGIGFCLWAQVQLSRYLEQILQPLTSPSHKPFALLPKLKREILLIKQQRHNLQQQLQIYEKLLESAPVGYLEVDEENQLLWCNQQAREILYLQRWQPGQVRLLLELVRSYELDQIIEQTRDLQQLQVKEWVFHPAFENAAAVIESQSLALRATSLPLFKGQVGVFLENLQPLLNMNQACDRSLSDIAHELRTPLTAIRLVAETLQDRIESPLERWVNRLLQEVDRLINLVQSWLELTQLENNPRVQLNRQPLEVRSLIASVWETLEPLAQRQQIGFTYSGADELWIYGDQSRIHQVFLNLLDNSIKFSPPCSSILIEAKIISPQDQHDSVVEINIIDSGVGFDEADLPYVFERFYRGDKARSRSSLLESHSTTTTVGSGLGLAIVRQIVLAHGGSIQAMNHPKTGGAWLQLYFPQGIANSSS
ncbi:PAS domain-containing sensor histidine kinase [Aetokthonos hydrillicola Thurmond2011]|jgi:two-component system phosphate regulon sensor histidine kinase PhoR|uniref:histidine kinase n=1 Tax=Aetokthonos hydrillicola Thurmond2011 TaxID=2712845 RepID=A0AAP5MA71_9CYAN|nr:ATP-binding protein [Aetokthonos hydrillicola]MBO3463249.1 PAS domain-containing protein [Aetokthonos hydrillicola CCALA 1050]MBW4583772.1 PAS domain-containing sensor histidine kinase [Aetokthonos hydrillicola CCALA 1050]MDR9895533.1 PAS domain-containing sensor histidine kinase [Aetokthonos hydrillicola Thurmond2011]